MELTTLIPAAVAAGGIKTINTGYVDSVTPTVESGEDLNYYDVTIPSINVSKSVPYIVGGMRVQYTSGASYTTASSSFIRAALLGTSPTGAASFNVTCRLLNSTTLRVSCPSVTSTGSPTKTMSFRWTVLESN